MPFKLHQPYPPRGDQPGAIEQLVEALEAGERHQTLLGVTGSGKSLAWDEPVLIRTRHAGGSAEMSLRAIGALVDTALGPEDAGRRDGYGTEVIAAPSGLEALSFNPRSGVTEWQPVSGFSRHAAPPMFRVQTECGREVVVTGDHNFFSLRDGALRLSQTSDLGADDYLALPLGFDLPDEELADVDLLDVFQDAARIEVYSPDALEWMIEQAGWPRVREAMAPHYRVPSEKRHAVLHGPKWRGIPNTIFKDLLSRLNLSLPDDLAIRVRTVHGWAHRTLPRRLAINDELLTFLGLMLAEGHCTRGNYAIFAAHEETVRVEFLRCATSLGLRVGVRKSSDLQISSALWNALLTRLVGAKSRTKHLPEFWPSLSRRQLAVLLRAYAEGDGGVDGASVSMTTASRKLASDLGYAFFGFGMWSRLHRRRKRATNSAHAGDWYHCVTLTGQSNLSQFAREIGFLTERKTQALRGLLGRPENSNVDVIPIRGADLTTLRAKMAVSKGRLARHADMSRAAVILMERGERRPSRASCFRILEAFEELGEPSDEVQALLESTRRMLHTRWTRVRSIEPAEYAHPHVYDLTVSGNETFLAGHGGLFVHNTYTVANVIARWNRPTLVISHNKTLAAQLYGEFKQFFPDGAVGYFISYYDYYQPEAYVPSTNTYIAKDSTINDDIDRLRLQATSMLLERDDVIIVASVSCIYGLGTPEDWRGMRLDATAGERASRHEILEKLVSIQYTRNDIEVGRGNFRVRGDVIEIHPAYEDSVVRIELDDDVVARISAVDPVTGRTLRRMDRLALYPAKHFVTPEPRLISALDSIREELEERVTQFKSEGKLLEAQRIRQRTEYDLEMLGTIGTCPGVENYSRHLSGRRPGERPGCLIDYFQGEFLLVIDESHVTVPQIAGMYEGDRSRKQTLVDFGFRLPSALDNRPLRFNEFERLTGPTLFISATPAAYELQKTKGVVVEQIIRPTGLVDPEVVVKPIAGQVDDLLEEIRQRVERRERVLVTTLTKRMAEDLTDYLGEMGVKVRYLHSDIDALERVEILRGLRLADFDVLVGINLLREGLDLPEVSLVAILDADKEGFLRSERSLIQTAGRAARNVNGRVILYADRMTDSMRRAMEETRRRRDKQLEYNRAHGITPRSIEKSVEEVLRSTSVADAIGEASEHRVHQLLASIDQDGPEALIRRLEEEMTEAARQLEFERAASLRDRIEEVRSALSVASRMGVVGTAGASGAAGGEAERHGRPDAGGRTAGAKRRRRSGPGR